jgi:hypothetical protein
VVLLPCQEQEQLGIVQLLWLQLMRPLLLLL